MLLEDNKKLMIDLDSLTESIDRLQSKRWQLDDEYEELKNKKDDIAQWEAQISEIIRWMSDENYACGYLRVLAAKMTERLEFLEH
jgi:serine/threonine-protein kinase MRCK